MLKEQSWNTFRAIGDPYLTDTPPLPDLQMEDTKEAPELPMIIIHASENLRKKGKKDPDKVEEVATLVRAHGTNVAKGIVDYLENKIVQRARFFGGSKRGKKADICLDPHEQLLLDLLKQQLATATA